MEKGSCNGKALPLTTGEIASLLFQHGVKAVLVFQKFQKANLLKSLFHFQIRRIRISHPKIVTDCPFEQVTVVAYQGDGTHQIRFSDLGYRDVVDPDLTVKGSELPGQKCGSGTFSTA